MSTLDLDFWLLRFNFNLGLRFLILAVVLACFGLGLDFAGVLGL